MLRVDRQGRSLKRLEQRPLTDAGLMERSDIQQMIKQSPEAFFGEMGESLLLIGEEVRPTDVVDDRIDLLAIDGEGAVVVIELKRGNHKLQLLQALAYAGMAAKFEASRLSEELARLKQKPIQDAADEIETFLKVELDTLNDRQRIILLAEDFDYEVLVAAEWLSEKYEVDIRCYRLDLSVDDSAEYLSCACIYPPPELSRHAVRRKAQIPAHPPRWENWEDALAGIDNAAVADFFRQQVQTGRSNNLRKRAVNFFIKGRRRFSATAKRQHAYVWQKARFDGDIEFWKQLLGEQSDVEPVRENRALRFRLRSAADFGKFLEAVASTLGDRDFVSEFEELDDEDGAADVAA